MAAVASTWVRACTRHTRDLVLRRLPAPFVSYIGLRGSTCRAHGFPGTGRGPPRGSWGQALPLLMLLLSLLLLRRTTAAVADLADCKRTEGGQAATRPRGVGDRGSVRGLSRPWSSGWARVVRVAAVCRTSQVKMGCKAQPGDAYLLRPD